MMMSKNFKSTVFRDVTQCSPLDGYRCFGRNCYLLPQGFFSGEMQAAVFSKQIMWLPFTDMSFQRIHVMFYKGMSAYFCTCVALDDFMLWLTLRPLNPTYSLIRSVAGPQNRSGLSQKREISRLCPESNPGLLSSKPTHYGYRCPGSFGIIILQD